MRGSAPGAQRRAFPDGGAHAGPARAHREFRPHASPAPGAEEAILPDTLTIIDNRTGKKYEVPIDHGTYPDYGAYVRAT